jgi:hypothetical protein
LQAACLGCPLQFCQDLREDLLRAEVLRLQRHAAIETQRHQDAEAEARLEVVALEVKVQAAQEGQKSAEEASAAGKKARRSRAKAHVEETDDLKRKMQQLHTSMQLENHEARLAGNQVSTCLTCSTVYLTSCKVHGIAANSWSLASQTASKALSAVHAWIVPYDR